MSFSVYNLQNQRLDSEQLRSLLSFCSDNYAGAVAEETPLSISGSTASLSGDSDFIVGGFLLNGESLEGMTGASQTLSSSNDLFGIVVKVDRSTYGIDSNDITANVTIGLISGFTITKLETEDETEVLYSILRDAEGWNPYHYDTQQFESITMKGSETPITGELYVIPLAGNCNGEVIELLGCFTKASLEDFLTSHSVDAFKQWASNTFVWRVGGPDKGDIGSINITDGTVAGENTSIVFDSSTSASSGNWLELNGSILNRNWTNDGTNPLLQEQAVIVLNDGRVFPGVVPVKAGGTGGETKDIAKTNLGFYIGTTTPNDGMGDDGDIYFKILS